MKSLTLKNNVAPIVIIASAIFVGGVITIMPALAIILATISISSVVLYFAIRSPFYAFLLFVVLLPFEAALVIELGFTIRPAYIGLLLVVLSLFMHGALSESMTGSFRSVLNVPILCFISVAGISLIMHIFVPLPEVFLTDTMRVRGSDFRGVVQWFLLIFFSSCYFVTLFFCSDEKKLMLVLKVYIGIAFVIAIYGIYQVIAIHYHLPFADITNALGTGGTEIRGPFEGVTDIHIFRPHATFQEPLNLAHYLLSVLPFLLSLYIYNRKTPTSNGKIPHIGVVPIIIMVIAFVFSQSRGAWIGFLVALLVIIAPMKAIHRIKLFFASSVAFLTLSIFIFFYFPEYENLLGLISHRLSDQLLFQDPRWAQLSFTLDLFKQYPLLGVGYGAYGLHHAAYSNSQVLGGALGIFWSLLAETGVCGFLVFSWLIVVYYKTLIYALKRSVGTDWYPYILGYLSSFSGMMVQYLSFGDRLNMYVWVFMAISMATVKLIDKGQK